MVETEGLAFRSWRGAALGQRIWGGGVGWGALTDRAAHRGYGPCFPCQSPFSSSRSLGRQGGGGSMGHPHSVLTGAFLPPVPREVWLLLLPAPLPSQAPRHRSRGCGHQISAQCGEASGQ